MSTPLGLLANRARRAAAAVWTHPALERVSPVTGTVTTLGWSVLALAVAAWLVGWQLGWQEFALLSAVCLMLLLICLVFLIGRADLEIELTLAPSRVAVGAPAAGHVMVTNCSRRPLLPLVVELPVGAALGRMEVPLLAPQAEHVQEFEIPTQRRAVIPVGPVTSVRGDPFGLFRRTVQWTEVHELFVHPKYVAVDSLTSGLLRDLEGRTTQEISMSDLAFHTLREYATGDDRRYIHWKSTARTGTFMVRQFVDTRRTHVAVVVDGLAEAYEEIDDFETAISVAASIAVRVLADEQAVSIFAAGQVLPGATGRPVMDALSRAEQGDEPRVSLETMCGQARARAADASLIVIISGRRRPPAELLAAARRLPGEARVVALRIGRSTEMELGQLGPLTLVTLSSLNRLPFALRAVGAA